MSGEASVLDVLLWVFQAIGALSLATFLLMVAWTVWFWLQERRERDARWAEFERWVNDEGATR